MLDLHLTVHPRPVDFVGQFSRHRNLSPASVTLLLQLQTVFLNSASSLHKPVYIHQIQLAGVSLSITIHPLAVALVHCQHILQ